MKMRHRFFYLKSNVISIFNKLSTIQIIFYLPVILHTFFELKDGIYRSSAISTRLKDFESAYLEVREKEKRILQIEEIRKLPFVSKDNHDAALWRTRRHNIRRFLKHLAKKNRQSAILDIGCGNGFFTNMMSRQGHSVLGIDVNLIELKQAVAAFGAEKIKWVYGDILNDPIEHSAFDIITFCCSFQYFENTDALLSRCIELLKPGGEIHIIDSPIYNETNKNAAKERSKNYFKQMNVLQMQAFYFHHSYAAFQKFRIQFKFKPSLFKTKLLGDSPFPWIEIKKERL